MRGLDKIQELKICMSSNNIKSLRYLILELKNSFIHFLKFARFVTPNRRTKRYNTV